MDLACKRAASASSVVLDEGRKENLITLPIVSRRAFDVGKEEGSVQDATIATNATGGISRVNLGCGYPGLPELEPPPIQLALVHIRHNRCLENFKWAPKTDVVGARVVRQRLRLKMRKRGQKPRRSARKVATGKGTTSSPISGMRI